MLLAVACFVMFVCLTQRAGVLHQLQIQAANVLVAENSAPDADSPTISPCELSAHSLFAAQPIHFDTVLLLPGLLLLLLAAPINVSIAPVPVTLFTPPLLRIHLKNCVFRE